MIRRLFICCAMLGFALLVWTQVVEAQGCVPSNIPTNTIAGFQILQPNQMPFAAVTMNVDTPISGNPNYSHVLTLGVGNQQGYNIGINYQAYNAASVSFYYSIDNGPRYPWNVQPPPSPTTVMNGTFYYDFSVWAGHVFYGYAVAKEKPGSGASTPSTQDIISVTVTNQTPGIYYFDGNDTNVYWAITMVYSGIPEVSFADCPAMRTAHHTPTATLQIQNVNSGEARNAVSVTGTTELAGNTVQASAVDYISALPGAKITGTYGGVTFCDVDNINFFGIQSLFRIEGAVTVVADLGHPPVPGNEKPVPSVIYDVAPICQNNCDPSDWQPTKVHSWAGRHSYWTGECQLLRAPDIDGVPWTPLCEFMNDASGAFGTGLIPTTIQLATGGLSLPYPGPAPDLPIPGKCTKYPVNVLFTVGPKDLANFFRNLLN